MTLPDPHPSMPEADASGSKLMRLAIWVAIGALIAAAIVCVVWVLVGPSNDIIGRAFLTILLLAGFAGIAILDASLAPRRPAWFALTSMVVWVVILLIGAFLIWMPVGVRDYGSMRGASRFFSFLVIVLILQLAVLHVRLYVKAYLRYVTTFTRIVAGVTIALVTILAFMLVFALVLGEFLEFGEWYWRIVVAITILAAVGTALIPLINVLFAPKKPRAAAAPVPYAPVAWPTYVDGVTPLPVLHDGSPDWNAYYTGYPSQVSQAIAPVVPHPIVEQPPAPFPPADWQAPPEWAAPQAPPPVPTGHEGYPPPPPLPPRP